MAVIGTIRNRFGTFLLIFIGLALAAFVLGDFFKSANKMRQSDRNLMGEVNGTKIYYSQFDKKLQENIAAQKSRSKKTNLTADEVFRIKQQTWNEVLEDIIMGEEREKLGIVITADELLDLMQGDDPHPWVVQSFKDPKTGKYDPEQVRRVMKQLETFSPQQQEQWFAFQNQVKDDWLQKKYNHLISGAYDFPTPFVEKDFNEKKTNAEVRVLAYKYNANNSKKAEPSDEDYRKYYDEYKERYERSEEMRDLKYVVFPVNPSQEDRVKTQKLVQEIYKDFQKSKTPVLFAHSESETPIDTNWHRKGELDMRIDQAVFGENGHEGMFIPPYFKNKVWTMAKVIKMGERPDSLKATHILVSYAGAQGADPEKVTRIKVQAKNLADSLYNIIKNNPAKMDELMVNSDDPSSKTNKGDLGWFKDGAMVPPFNEAVVNGKIGDIVMVETRFGFHIINITGKTEPKKVAKVVTITKELTPSRETNEKVFADASDFQIKATSPEVFDTLAKSLNLGVRKAENLTRMSNHIAGLDGPRNIVLWAFRDERKVGDVSEVYTFTDKFVVAILDNIKPKGIPELDEIKSTLKPLVTKAVEVERLAKEMEEKLQSNQDINALAEALNLKVDTIKTINFAMRSVPRFGREEKLMGAIFGSPEQMLSKVIKGNNAAFVFVVDKFDEPAENEKKDVYKKQLENTFKRKLTNKEVFQALKKKADIVDYRANFY